MAVKRKETMLAIGDQESGKDVVPDAASAAMMTPEEIARRIDAAIENKSKAKAKGKGKQWKQRR